jgi:hypothetical protein
MEPKIAAQEKRMQAALAAWKCTQGLLCAAAQCWDRREIDTSVFTPYIYREREAEKKYNLEMQELNRLCRIPYTSEEK